MQKKYKLEEVPRRKHGDKIMKIMDPIHNFIDISEYPVIPQLIDTPYFQRLRRLYQLGLASVVYPNATHTRFAHSIGVMHTFLVLFDSVTTRSTHVRTPNRLRPIGAVAALLHDIGHGPFSHVSEKFLERGNFDHESMTQKIILETEIAGILKKNHIEPELVCDILTHQVPNHMKFVSQLISSQLDADRLDYLMRDSLFTGVPYGKIDIHRIANTLSIWNSDTPTKSLKGTIVVSKKGIEAVENYLVGRYHMYKGVYFHKTVRCVEEMLVSLFRYAMQQKSMWSKIADIENDVTPEAMLTLDDHVFYSAILNWRTSHNKVLKDMSLRIINRKLLKILEVRNSNILKSGLDRSELAKVFKKKNLNPKYHYLTNSIFNPGYLPYAATEQDSTHSSTSHIMVHTESNGLKEISDVSLLVRTISHENATTGMIFVPSEVLAETKSHLELI